MKNITQKGAITIILSVLLLSIALVISLGISNLMINQIQASTQIGHSVVAFYAAEIGAEKCYFERRVNGAVSCDESVSLDVIAGASYTVKSINPSSLIMSVGNFKETNRRIEITW